MKVLVRPLLLMPHDECFLQSQMVLMRWSGPRVWVWHTLHQTLILGLVSWDTSHKLVSIVEWIHRSAEGASKLANTSLLTQPHIKQSSFPRQVT